MKVTLTDKGLQALAQNHVVQLLDFVAGDSKSLSMMERFIAGQSVGSNTFYQYGIEESHTYTKGDTYTPSDGGAPYRVENTFLELRGTLNCLSVPSSFVMYSLGIKAKIGDDPPFIYAFGSISSSDKPYPVNSGELISYITPVKIIYDNAPDVTTEESGVPWKNFIQHTDTYVSTSEGAHGLKIDPVNLTMTVGETTISLAGGEERVAELEQEVQGILKYKPSDTTRPYNDQLVLTILSPADGDGTSGNPYKIRTPLDFWVVGTFKTDSNQFFYDSTVYPEGDDQSYYYPNEHYSLQNNLDLYHLIGVKKKSPSNITPVSPGMGLDNLTDELEPIPSAPCYNNGRGYESWGLVSNNSYFYGNGHYITNLYIGPVLNTDPDYNNSKHYRRYGLFNRIGGNSCTISGITLVDSRIIAGYDYDCHVGSILSTTDNSGNCEIRNCVSYAEIEKIGRGNGIYGGIVGKMQANLGVYFCAFHGKITDYYNQTSYGFGGIGGSDGGYCVIGCYCDAVISLNTSGYTGGLRDHWLPGNTDYVTGGNYYNGSYFAGSLSNRRYDIQQYPFYSSSITGQYPLTLDPVYLVPLKFTFSLQGSAPFMQGNVRTREQMLSRDFVDELNTTLPANSPVNYVYNEGTFPRLSFEAENIPTSAPLATINTSNNYVLDSGFTVRDLTQTATQANLNTVNLNLQMLLAQHYKMKIVYVTVQTTDWNGSREYVYYDDDLMFVTNYQAQILPIPSGQDFIDHFVTCTGSGRTQVSGTYRGFARFRCDSLPSADLTFPVIMLY